MFLLFIVENKLMELGYMYTVSQKQTSHYTFVCNIAKC